MSSTGTQGWRGGVLALLVAAAPLGAQSPSQGPVPATEAAPPADTRTADQWLECAGRNGPDGGFRQRVRFEVTDAQGGGRSFEARVLGLSEDDGLRLNFRIDAPPDLAGMAALIREHADKRDQLDLYLPALRRTRRVTERMAHTKLFGTDFSYIEIKQVFGTFIEGTRSLGDRGAVAGRPVQRVLVRPPPGADLPFAGLRAEIDTATCVPLRVDFVGADGRVLKRLAADPGSLVALGARHIATRWRLDDYETRSTTTLAELTDTDFDREVPKMAFDERRFHEVN